jgi:pantoate--beta-alanine ligase
MSMRPFVAHTRAELEAAKKAALAARTGRSGHVAVVMTMGALHAGHVALIRAARARASVVLVTIFVNPLQFGPGEDLDRYPRTLPADLEICAAEGVDVVFAPSADEVYPGGQPVVRLDPGHLGERLEGEFRPGFFCGVLTVVAKLLHLTAPDLAYFGQKDAQQLALVRRMVTDLNFPVEIVAVPTVREPDGLALSSRNRYLSGPERVTALALSRALAAGAAVAAHGVSAVHAGARAVLNDAFLAEPPLSVDYLALVDPGAFVDVADDYTGPAVLAVAARVGTTRLIDNVPLTLGAPVLAEPSTAVAGPTPEGA